MTRELNEALERQAATAEILRLISSSPTGVQPVFDAIARNFVLLCGSIFGAIYTLDGELVHLSGSYGFSAEQLGALREKYPVRIDDRSVLSSRAILAKTPLHIQNIKSDPDYDRAHAAAVSIGRLLAVPLLRDGTPLGAIVGGWAKPGATPKQHEELLQVFADQAVIAIENARLLNELREFYSNRLPRPMCSRSSVARPSIYRLCSTPWPIRRARCVKQKMYKLFYGMVRSTASLLAMASHLNIRNM